jgi:predicted amidophosphoribosyltransferase
MDRRFIRVYKELDIEDVSKHLIIFGDLHGTCSNCSKLGLNFSIRICPECKTEFKYATFSSQSHRVSQMDKIVKTEDLIFIDYNDYKRIMGKIKARDFFK